MPIVQTTVNGVYDVNNSAYESYAARQCVLSGLKRIKKHQNNKYSSAQHNYQKNTEKETTLAVINNKFIS